MKVMKLLASIGTTSVIAASLVVNPALAWHPQAKITKSVQDMTTSGQTVSTTATVNINTKTDSETASQVIPVAPGDELRYTVIVENPASSASNNYDDLANALMIDKLPQGVQLTNSTALTQSIGNLAPGKSKTYNYTVKVTDQTDGDILTNKACVTGGSANNDVTGLKACASVSVKVTVPQQPTPTPTPKTTTTPQQPTKLPDTGAGNVILPAALVSILGYAGYLLRLKRHNA